MAGSSRPRWAAILGYTAGVLTPAAALASSCTLGVAPGSWGLMWLVGVTAFALGAGLALAIGRWRRRRRRRASDDESAACGHGELVAQRQLLQAVLDQMPAGVVIAEAPSGRIIQSNAIANDLFPWRYDEVTGIADYRRFGALHADGTPFAVEDYPLVRALHGEVVTDAELYYRNDKGEPVVFVASAAPVWIDGRVGASVVAFNDLTERRRADDERRFLFEWEREARQEAERLAESAREADRRKDEFLAMLGHELRNPLAPIVTALQLLELRGDPPTREQRVIERQVQHLKRLVDDLLDVSRITRGKVELERSPVEMADVVARAVEMASPLFEERLHALDVVVPPHGLRVDGDEGRLAQVVANLLTNAARYTEPGGAVRVSADVDHGDVVLRVRDSGMGIEPELLPHVFELFVQGRRAGDRVQGGLGLGLALVSNLVALHGGIVSASSAGRGRGSEFVVRLPHYLGALEPPPLETRPLWRPRAPAGRTVLIVDDNVEAAELMAEALRAYGYRAAVAFDSARALELAQDLDPDVGILDIGLPVMDGYELARRLRARRPLRLVAITGYGQEQDRLRALGAGFDWHLVKPVDLDELLLILAEEPARIDA